MTDELERQIRAWVDDIDDPIPVDDVRLGQHSSRSPQPRAPIVFAAAAVLLLIAGVVAVLASSGSSSNLETVADSAEDTNSTVPDTSSAPTTQTTPEPTTSAPTTTSSTTPERAPRTGTVSEIVDPPDGENCEGLRSRTVWVSTGTDQTTAAAGGWADYVETVTNEGAETCTMVFQRCPGVGVLYAEDGTRAPEPMRGCPAVLHAPEDLVPGASHQETFTAELFTAPGDYELRVSQLDGRLATLPIRLEPQMEACDPGTLTLDQQPHEAGASRNDTTFAQLLVTGTQASCTVRITETRLTLRPEDDPDGPERTFLDGASRWYDISAGRIMADVFFGPIDLPPGSYGGVITIHLENGETLRKPAHLLVY